MAFHPVNPRLVGQVCANFLLFPGFDHCSIFYQPAFRFFRQANLEGDTTTKDDFISHDGILIAGLGSKPKAARGSRVIIPDKRMSIPQRIPYHPAVCKKIA